VTKVNAWLAEEPGVVHISPVLHRDHHGTVSGMTLTCFASSRDPDYRLRFDRIALLGRFGLRSRDVGETLNAWTEQHPLRTRVTHQVFARMGQPTECWLLSKGPRDDGPVQHTPPRFRLSVWLHAVVALATLVGATSLVIGIGAVTHTSPWLDPFALVLGLLAAGVTIRPWPRPRRTA
jgi:hypothetical protein